jgi:hypothetical protein
VLCLIKDEFVPFVKQITISVGNFLLFIIDKRLFGVTKDILYVCAYVPPEGSNYYAQIEDDVNGIDMLENCLIDNALADRDLFVIMSGDLNGRTSNCSQPIGTYMDFQSINTSTSVSIGRHSQDMTINSYGKSLLNMCTTLNLCIMNGVCNGNRHGHYTYISDFGCSVIDYFLMSSDLFANLFDFCSMNIIERIDTKHLPISLSINVLKRDVGKNDNTPNDDNGTCEKMCWNPENHNAFMELLGSKQTEEMLKQAVSLIDSNVNDALKVFNECLHDTAIMMKRLIYCKSRKKEQDWFDSECRLFRKSVRRALRKFRRTNLPNDRFDYCKLRREYKHLLSRKKSTYNKNIIDELLMSINDQKLFWEKVNNISRNRKHNKNNINIQQWFEHFSKLLDKEYVDESNKTDDDDDVTTHDNLYFNRPISKEEVMLALRKLKFKKAAGPDGLVGEVFRHGCDIIAPFFVRFLNKLFDSGIFPDDWTESIIVALYKKGNVNDPGNYRGISISNISSKVYSTIINRRIQTWVSENDITGEFQAGFKPGYSTIDNIFVLMACVQKQFALNRKLYVAFIDFQKAFDSINRHLLWPILNKNGIKGKLLRCIKSMYNHVKVRVRSGTQLTPYVNCSAGVKQGDNCSPVLFSLFINELAIEIIKNGKHGVTFFMDNFELFTLLLADDIILVSETVIGLQTQLNSLYRASTALGLTVNMEKSNIIVFRKGGYLASRERWLYNGIIMPVSNIYKYLGVHFTTRLSFTATCKELGSKAKGAFLCIHKKLSILKNSSTSLALKLFDAKVQPIAQYGSEIWGLYNATCHIEKMHLYALKKLLGVNRRTPNDLVYGEVNRYPIVINCIINTIRYWLKIIYMRDRRLPKKAYVMIKKLDERGKETWATNVRLCLFKYGFGYVWLNQGVGNVKVFLRILKQRLIDMRWQEWSGHVEESDRFKTFRLCGGVNHSLLPYLNMKIEKHLKFVMTKFRFGVSDLATHYAKYRFYGNVNLICPVCLEAEENEIHFMLVCPFYRQIRKELIPAKFTRTPNAFKLLLLFSSRRENIIIKLCVYLYKAFKMRETATS